MRSWGAIERVRRDPGLVMVLLAIAAVIVVYAPTLGRGLVSYDDPWLVRDNWIAGTPSLSSLRAIWFDLSPDTRFVLGAEYLPIRDVSVMLDHVLWGDWYGGFHLTNLALYVGAIVLWFLAVVELGVDRRIAGVMALVWALHPAHAESVAWLAERKGLLGVMFAGAAALGFARFRAGRSVTWLAVAAVAAAFAVWSKAPSAFAIAALAGLEVALPERRRTWRRSLAGLAGIAIVAGLAFIPVLVTASEAAVVGTQDHAPAGWLAMVVGLHGFYARLAALAVQNAPSYPIATAGPSSIDLVLGTVTLILALAVAAVPAWRRWRPPGVLRAAAVLWVLGWIPISRAVLPLRAVLVADRYLLIPTLGFALAVAFGLAQIERRRLRISLTATIVLAAGLRTLDAQGTWADSETLWQRAVASNPADGDAWSLYAEATWDAGRRELTFDIIRAGLTHTESPRLKLRAALLALELGQRPDAIAKMREAAEAGENRAMSNLALLLDQDHEPAEALLWARRAVESAPRYVNGQRVLGKIALAAGRGAEALAAFEQVYALEPGKLTNRFNLGLALRALGRPADARPHFEACLADPALGPRARALL